MYNKKAPNISTSNKKVDSVVTATNGRGSSFSMERDFLFYLAFLMSLGALMLNQAQALSLISEKCDPNKVGPDETTVKGGWQAEMFNGLSFRTCGK